MNSNGHVAVRRKEQTVRPELVVCTPKCEENSTCLGSCLASLTRLRSAAASVLVSKPSTISMPSSSIVRSLPRVDTDRPFNGMMFAGGINVGGRDVFTARLCTNGCVDQTSAGLYSTVIVGELSGAEHDFAWKHASALEIPHNKTGWFVGPEDPRIDVVDGARFVLANVNVEVRDEKCKKVHHEYEKPRQMFFSPVDAIPDAKPCLIQVDGVSRCKVEKNWAPLVPKDSKEIYYVYSLNPFRVVHFNKKACSASFVSESHESRAVETGMEDVHGVPHGGTRFVHGMTVPDGDVYFAFGHTGRGQTTGSGYKQVLAAVLVKYADATRTSPTFQLLGMSCPLKFSSIEEDTRGNAMPITTSIIDYDRNADVARITFQAHDSENFHSEVRGIQNWLQTSYSEFHNGGPVYCVPEKI